MINVAVYRPKPVLVTDWPGTGTSTLACLIALERAHEPVLRWPIILRTALKDGLYLCDAIGWAQEINALQSEELDIRQFVHLGLLGTALLPYERPWVLLIDELDTSDIDELFWFAARRSVVVAFDQEGSVVALRGWVRCRAFLIVIITSNDERRFPAPLLCRCLKLDGEPPTFKHLGVTSVLVARARRTSVALVGLVPQRLWHLSRLTAGYVAPFAASLDALYVRLPEASDIGESIKNEIELPIPALGLESERRSKWILLITVIDTLWHEVLARKQLFSGSKELPLVFSQESSSCPLSAALTYLKVMACNVSECDVVELHRLINEESRKLNLVNIVPGLCRSSTELDVLSPPTPGNLLTHSLMQEAGREDEAEEPDKGDKEHPVSRTQVRPGRAAIVSVPQVWGGAPLRNTIFAGGEVNLAEVKNSRSQYSQRALIPQASSGLWGIRSSQLVAEFTYHCLEDYPLVWWGQVNDDRLSGCSLAGALGQTEGVDVRDTLGSGLDISPLGDLYSWRLLIRGNVPKPVMVDPRLLACLDKMRTEPAEPYGWKS